MPFEETPRPYSLQFRLMLFVLLPLLGVSAVAGYLSLQRLEAQIEQRMKEDVELIARAVRLPLSVALEQQAMEDITRTLESLFTFNRVYGAYVYNAEGHRVAAIGYKEGQPEKRHLAEVAASGERQGEYQSMGGRKVYSYFVPLPDSIGRINGLLQITRRKSDMDQSISGLRVQGIIFWFLAGGALAALIFLGHHGVVGRHLTRLTAGMERIKAGDRRHRALLAGPNEIRTLASSFNTMLDGIESASRELERNRAARAVLEERLHKAERLAAIGRLAGGVAHELGAPLTVIEGKARRLLRTVEDAGPLGRHLIEIRREVRRMEHIVRQLLDFGRQSQTRRRTVRMARLAYSAASAVKNEAELAGVALEVAAPGDEPRIVTDPYRFERALINLLRNGIQAAPGGVVRLSWNATEHEAVFTVEDNGPGLSPEIKPRLFEPFFTTKAPGHGTGLGLAVVHGIVEEHGGRIEAGDSRLGGASFTITLPRGKDIGHDAGPQHTPNRSGNDSQIAHPGR